MHHRVQLFTGVAPGIGGMEELASSLYRATFIKEDGSKEEQTEYGEVLGGGNVALVVKEAVPDWFEHGDEIVIADESGSVIGAFVIERIVDDGQSYRFEAN